MQAKRWNASSVGRPEVQKFVGALHGHHAGKGVFITTSAFSKEAHDYVRSVAARIELIDGARLARLMADYGVGISVRRSYPTLGINEDYFAEEET